MLFSRHAAITTFSKQRTALQFHFLCVEYPESRCTLVLPSRAGTHFWKKPRSVGGEMP
jgi:hypothetical protein